MTHKEFYIWLDGYFSVKSKEENDGNVYFMDIVPIIEKMKEVKDDSENFMSKFLEKRTQNFHSHSIKIDIDDNDDDLGKPPKIVM